MEAGRESGNQVLRLAVRLSTRPALLPFIHLVGVQRRLADKEIHQALLPLSTSDMTSRCGLLVSVGEIRLLLRLLLRHLPPTSRQHMEPF